MTPGSSSNASIRARGIAALRADPSLTDFAMRERFGVDDRSIVKWRRESRKPGKRKSHNRPRCRPRRLA